MRELVLTDFRLAEVFNKYKLNYCCAISLPLETACRNAGLDVEQVLGELLKVGRNLKIPGDLEYESWPLHFLLDYLVNVYHSYLRKTLPELESDLIRYVQGHPDSSTETLKLPGIYQKLASVVTDQMAGREKIIFPYIRQLDSAFNQQEAYGTLYVKTLRKPLTEMERSLLLAAELMTALERITFGFLVPEKSCAKYKVLVKRLEQVYEVLAEQHQIEHAYLFPRAMEVERKLLAA